MSQASESCGFRPEPMTPTVLLDNTGFTEVFLAYFNWLLIPVSITTAASSERRWRTCRGGVPFSLPTLKMCNSPCLLYLTLEANSVRHTNLVRRLTTA